MCTKFIAIFDNQMWIHNERDFVLYLYYGWLIASEVGPDYIYQILMVQCKAAVTPVR